MQPKGHPTEAGLHPRQPNGAKSVSKGIKMCQKDIQSEQSRAQSDPHGAKRSATATKMEAKVGQVLDLYGLGIDFGSYFGALWEQIPSTIASKIDAKINAEKVKETNAQMYERYVEFNGKSMSIH